MFLLRYFFVFLFFCSSARSAGLYNTRHVYYEKSGPESMVVVNTDPHPVLVEFSVSDATGKPAPVKAFPNVFTIPAKNRRVVKVYGLNNLLNPDSELINYINITSVSPTPKKDGGTMQVTITARYKLMLRPLKMKAMTLEDAVNKLHTTCKGFECFLVNDSPFNIVFSAIQADGKELDLEVLESGGRFLLGRSMPRLVSATYVNDSGIYVTKEIKR